jgi:hypothetical protein
MGCTFIGKMFLAIVQNNQKRDNGQGSLKGNSFGSISGAIFT